MRLGSILMTVGIVLLITAAILSPTTSTTERGDDCFWVDGELICNQNTVEEPNALRSIMLLLGGFLFSGGWGGWVGTYNTEQRLEKRLKRLGVKLNETDYDLDDDSDDNF